jgi:hydroxymethylbilane synthase
MSRIVLGHRDGPLATRQARTVLAELSAEWPDVQIVLRTIPSTDGDDPLLDHLAAGRIGLALSAVDRVAPVLPENVTLSAVGRRLEARSALVARGVGSLADLPSGARVAVRDERDRTFLAAALPQATGVLMAGTIDDELASLVAGECDALVVPAALLIALERRDRIDALLDPEVFAPAAGQGAMGLLVRNDDDAAAELAYTLQHRASFDRIRAERAFAAGVADHRAIGALATIDDEGDLVLFGAVAAGGTVLQVTTTGDPKDAADVGAELARDVMEQLAALR